MLLTPFELFDAGAAGMGVDRSEFAMGPFDRAGDHRWAARERGEITEREYWAGEAERFGLDIVGFMQPLYNPSGDHLVRAASCELIDEVLADGRTVGLLTNDLTAFHEPGWHEAISVLGRFDPLIDLSSTGHLKPHPRAYQVAIAAMGVDADDIVFVDDHLDNVAGGAAAGMVAVWFDVTDPPGSLARVRSALAREGASS